MTTVPVEEAGQRFDELVARALEGERVVLTRGDLETLELGVVPTAPTKTSEPRVPGRWKGRIKVGPEFFDPLPEDELQLWWGDSPRGRKIES